MYRVKPFFFSEELCSQIMEYVLSFLIGQLLPKLKDSVLANGKYQGFKVLLKLTLGMKKMEVILNRLRFQNKSRRLTKNEIMLFSHPRSKEASK